MMTGRVAWRRPFAVISATLISLVLSACSISTTEIAKPKETGKQLASSIALDAAWQQASYADFYKQKIEWRACTSEDGLDEEVSEALKQTGGDSSAFKCGTVKAPLNWADPSDTRTIDLGVMRVPSTGDTAKAVPIFTNPGGPGVSGIKDAILMTTNASFGEVMKTHELWGFDPRGIGRSTPVTCESKSNISSVQVAECANSHPVGHYMGSSQVARDLELLRNLSGAPRLDYIGYSYGTMLGATYATLFPENAGRMILDSAENSKWATLEHSYDQQVAIARTVGELVENCSSLTTSTGGSVSCPFATEREMLDYKKSLNDNPMKASDGTEINEKALRDFLQAALYSIPGDAFDLLGRAKSGDQQAIDEMATQIKGGGAEIDTAGQLVFCPSAPKTPDLNGLIAHIKKVGVPEYLGGPELTDDLLSEFTSFDCAPLPGTGTELTDFDASKTKNPLLVIGITGDHATPFQHGKELARQLGNASFLTLKGIGHGASFSQLSTCVDAAATAYLNEGKLPEEGAVCTQGK
ncbi:alpha/beta hydrolase [Actinomyces bovis]|nr:alpha/beta hydrolase [Actinomyces bovis]